MILLKLIWAFFQTGLLSIGGGYAALPIIRRQVVEINGWIDQQKFGDLLAISEMTPGPVSLNAATFVGMQTAGLAGAIAATLGFIMPSCAVVLILGKLYLRYRRLPALEGAINGLHTGVSAAIISTAITITSESLFMENIAYHHGAVPLLIFGAAFLLLRLKQINPIYIIVGSGAVGAILSCV